MRAIALAIILAGGGIARAIRNREFTKEDALVQLTILALFSFFLVFGV